MQQIINALNKIYTAILLLAPMAKINGYAIQCQALTASPADSVSNYFGTQPITITTTVNLRTFRVPKNSILKRASFLNTAGTAGTAENYSLYIRVNNTTDYLVATVAAAANYRLFENTALNITLNAGDTIEMKTVNPVWVTNPLTSIWGGYLYFEEI